MFIAWRPTSSTVDAHLQALSARLDDVVTQVRTAAAAVGALWRPSKQRAERDSPHYVDVDFGGGDAASPLDGWCISRFGCSVPLAQVTW
jgi:hypothetical protein